MKQITLIIIIILLNSCNTTQEEFVSNKDSSNKRAPSPEYLYAEDLFYIGITAEINYLEQLENELIYQLENGNESVYEQYLVTQSNLEILNNYKDLIFEIRRPLRPGGVIPFPPPTPLPCDGNVLICQPKQNFTNMHEIVSEGFGKMKIKFEQENHVVGDNVGFGEDFFGQKTTRIDTDFEGEAIMYSIIQLEDLPEITIMNPVFID